MHIRKKSAIKISSASGWLVPTATMGLNVSAVVKPCGRPLLFLHSFSFSRTWNNATTFLRQLLPVNADL